jgi:hypothetical protein
VLGVALAEADESPVAAGSPTTTPGSACPTFGTYTRSPSTSLAARLSRSRSASAGAPPTASTASMTRAPAGSSTTPGRATAPATCTAIRPWVVDSVVVVVVAALPAARGLIRCDAVRAALAPSPPPSPTRYHTMPATTATATSTATPTRASVRQSCTRSMNRSSTPGSGGRGANVSGAARRGDRAASRS